MGIEEVLAGIAEKQRSLVTRDQTRSAGLSDDQRRRWVRAGRLRAVHDGVMAVAGSEVTWEQRIMAAVLAAGDGAVASHVTAGAIWGFPNLDPQPLPIEITTTRPPRVRLRRVRVHRTLAFLEREHTMRNGLPVTTPARTLVDLSAFWSVQQLGIATDFSMRKLFMRLDDLRTCAAGLHSGPGRKLSRIEKILVQRLPGYDPGDSGLEIRVMRAIVAHGLPEPIQQHELRLPDRLCRIDLAYPDYMIAIEVDGWRDHGRRSAFEPDRARGNDLAIAEWLLLRFTSESTDRQIGVKTEAALRSRGWRPDPLNELGRIPARGA